MRKKTPWPSFPSKKKSSQLPNPLPALPQAKLHQGALFESCFHHLDQSPWRFNPGGTFPLKSPTKSTGQHLWPWAQMHHLSGFLERKSWYNCDNLKMCPIGWWKLHSSFFGAFFGALAIKRPSAKQDNGNCADKEPEKIESQICCIASWMYISAWVDEAKTSILRWAMKHSNTWHINKHTLRIVSS